VYVACLDGGCKQSICFVRMQAWCDLRWIRGPSAEFVGVIYMRGVCRVCGCCMYGVFRCRTVMEVLCRVCGCEACVMCAQRLFVRWMLGGCKQSGFVGTMHVWCVCSLGVRCMGGGRVQGVFVRGMGGG
jgi:hypothetical protein